MENTMKKMISLLLVVCLVLTLAACGTKGDSTDSGTPAASGDDCALDIMFVVTGSLGGGNNVDDVKEALDEYVVTYGGSVQTFECNMDTSVYQAQLEAAAEI